MQSDKVAIECAVDWYIQSINEGSAKAGTRVFHISEDTTFIHPRGTERGWNKIDNEIYSLFRDTFVSRTLKRTGNLNISIYGDAAIVDFEWDFVATFRDDGAPLHTTGRESQVYHKFADEGWRIIHVHYSGPPVTGIGEGF